MILSEEEQQKQRQVHSNGTLQTYTGVMFDLMNPQPDKIVIDDIAHALANTCRWNGHTSQYFSVAQHCCMMWDAAPTEYKLTYLLHDGEEAYWGDIISPIKSILKEVCPDLYNRMVNLRMMILEKYNALPENECSKLMDYEHLQWEYHNLIKTPRDAMELRNCTNMCWLPLRAKNEFLERFYASYENKTQQ
jgi:5'-deoxynucleotidase YfbR-like HD superfamily hydrolase